MQYIDISEFGGPEVMAVKTGPIPEPKAGELLIRVKAAGVNRPDILQRQGLYPSPPDASPVLGLEVAGEVVQIGDGVADWSPADIKNFWRITNFVLGFKSFESASPTLSGIEIVHTLRKRQLGHRISPYKV